MLGHLLLRASCHKRTSRFVVVIWEVTRWFDINSVADRKSPDVWCVLGRGGQSALRFARLRMEKRHNYVRKVAETAIQMFISNDRPNVAGLVLAGSADFKTELSQSDMFDQVL